MLLYFAFMLGVGYVLVRYSKTEGLVLVNSTWTPFQDVFFKYATYLGNGEAAIAIVLFLALFVSFRKGIIALSSFVLSAIVTQFFKHLIFSEAMRPYIILWDDFKNGDLHLVLSEEIMKRGNSFPSGHTTSAFSVCLVLVLFIQKPVWALFLGFVAIIASYSRVYLAQHFFEDVFAGAIIGVSGTLIVYFLFERKNWLANYDKPLLKLK